MHVCVCVCVFHTMCVRNSIQNNNAAAAAAGRHGTKKRVNIFLLVLFHIFTFFFLFFAFLPFALDLQTRGRNEIKNGRDRDIEKVSETER